MPLIVSNMTKTFLNTIDDIITLFNIFDLLFYLLLEKFSNASFNNTNFFVNINY